MKLNSERGQILVQVALMVTVLFAFVALALDGGQIYAGRRRMQNAADAGALAGAQQICFPQEGQTIEQAALDYAIDRNGAQTATVAIVDETTVVVTAEQTLDTFFAGVIGINTANVRAEAAAACGGSVSGAGLWPLAFKQSRYITIPCGSEFLVFSSKQEFDETDWAPDYCDCDLAAEEKKDYEYYDDCWGKCIPDFSGMGIHIDTSDRGWLLFPDPQEPYELPDDAKCPGVNACGAGRVGCWLRYNYPGEIAIGDCVSGQPGVDHSVDEDVDARAGDLEVIEDGDIVQPVLWDETECELDPDLKCQKDSYYVVGFGCIRVVRWDQWQFNTCGKPGPCATLHVVRAIKICDDPEADDDDYDLNCASSGGSTSGVPPEEWENRSVSLIRWPPADE